MVHLPIRNGAACSKPIGCLLHRTGFELVSVCLSSLIPCLTITTTISLWTTPSSTINQPRALEAILSFSIDRSPLIQYILILEFSIQKVSPISLVFKFWEPLNTSKPTAINKASFSFQGSELERGASEYIPRSTWFSARHHPPTISPPPPPLMESQFSVAPFPRGMAGKNHLETLALSDSSPFGRGNVIDHIQQYSQVIVKANVCLHGDAQPSWQREIPSPDLENGPSHNGLSPKTCTDGRNIHFFGFSLGQIILLSLSPRCSCHVLDLFHQTVLALSI